MQQIGTITRNQHLERSSKTDPIAKSIPVEKQRALGDVFDRWRLNQGWNPWDNKTQLAAIASFVHSLDIENIPAAAYGELYERILQLRAEAIANGKQIPSFGVELMLSCWPSLKAELRQREIDSGRFLTATAPTQCLRCYGTGLEQMYDDVGNKLGVREGCKHEYIDESDPSTAGIDNAIKTLNNCGESALDICQRLKKDIAKEWVSTEDDDLRRQLWRTSGTMTRIERYIRENPETASRILPNSVDYSF